MFALQVETLAIQSGYWRITHTSIDVRPCPLPSACAGGNQSNAQFFPNQSQTCEGGSVGVYCMACVQSGDHFFFDRTEERCMRCNWAFPVALTLFIFFLAVGLLVWSRRSHRPMLAWRWLRGAAERARLMHKVKLAISYYQIATQIESAIHMYY